MSDKSLSALFTLIFRCALICVACAALAHAQTTINVPADQPTIQSAINAAQPGDTVLVAPGTYIENLDFLGKAITVTSSDGPAVTIVDGNAAGPVVTFQTSEGDKSVLNGFTLQNGAASQGPPFFGTSGGGILILDASPTVTNNVITRNHAVCGVGIEIAGGTALIRGNTITGNTQSFGNALCGGAGIEITGSSAPSVTAPQIIGNTITFNALPVSGSGGGIAVLAALPTIENNYIANNTGWNSGGGVYLSSGSPLLLQNIIVNNSTSVGPGAGIAISGDQSSAQQIIGNTIVGNIASDGSSGVYTDVSAQVVISNNIVVAADGENGAVCGDLSQIFPSFSHNDITLTGTGGQTISSNCASAAQGNGNISVDPLFVSAANGDYHLQAGSPAIDAGDNSSPNLPEQDYDGKTRVIDGNNDCVNTVDLGAYELQVAVAASFDPASLSFGEQNLGSTSSSRGFQLSNTGPNCVSTAGLTTTGDFAQSYNTCSGQLFTGQSCLIYVTFSPSALGPRSGTLSLSGLSGGIQPTATLSGTGVDSATASISPSSVIFKEQLVGTQSVTLTISVNNAGPGTLHISSLTESGDPDFLVLSNACAGFSVAAGASCPVQIAFAPKSAGPGTATFTFASDALNNPISVAASGTGVLAAVASVLPSLFSFGNVIEGTQSRVQTFTVSNSGNLTLHVSGVNMTGDADFSIVTNNCAVGSEVLPGGSCTIQVEFAPQSVGAGSASLTIASDAVNDPVSVTLSGTGVTPPQASVSPVSINFGNVFIGTGNSTPTVTISNTGGAPLHITSLAITGDGDFFPLTNSCVGGTGIAPGGSCTIPMEFQPRTSGMGSATLTITSDASNGSVSVPLSGTGVSPATASVSPTAVNFGSQAVGAQSPSQTVSVTNTGSGAMTISAASISGDLDFLVTTNGCLGALGAGSTCIIQVAFGPKSVGSGSATLTISSDASNNPVSVALSGSGVTPPIASVSPASINFGNVFIGTGNSTPTVTVSNTGVATLHINSLGITGDADFFTVSNNCVGGPGVAPGGSCTIQMEFQPHSAGPGSATLTIGSDASNGAVSVSLSGTGVSPATASVSPSALTFGNQPVGTQSPSQTVTVSSTGTGPLHISSLAISGDADFSILNSNCPVGSEIIQGSSCIIQVAFAPKALGPGSATLTITSDASNNPVSVALSGTGVNPPNASVSPVSLSFGSLGVGTESTAQTVTVSDIGGANLHINSQLISGDADFFISNSNCVGGSGVLPGGSCSIQVAFFPHSAGPGSATLTIGSDASNGAVSVSLSGTGVSLATASASPSAVNFGSQTVGTQSASQTVSVTNTGSGAMTISAAPISGDVDFLVTANGCLGTLGAGSTCIIQVAFAPKSVGPGSATLTIVSDAGNGPVSVALSGTGVNPPKASVSPASLSFGSLLPGTESAPQTVTVSNIGGAALLINSQLVTGDSDFFISNSNCVGGPGVAPGSSCSIQVVFFPHSGGPGSATLTITSNDPAAPQQSVSLTGTGIDYAVSAPASLSVRSGDKVQPTITVSAVGGNFSNPVALSCSGLPTGASCSFSPASVVPGAGSASSSLSINTQQSGGIKTPLGTYTIIVNGTSVSSVHSAPITLTVTK